MREAGEGDDVALAGLAHKLGYEVTVEQVLSRLPQEGSAASGGAVFVAEDSGGRMLGWIQVFARTILVDSSAELGGLIVGPGHRRRRVGAALLAEAERWARNNGFDRVRVRSNVVRDGAAAFYQARGYAREKTQNVFFKELGAP